LDAAGNAWCTEPAASNIGRIWLSTAGSPQREMSLAQIGRRCAAMSIS
jgi:hypothetical protein